LLKLKDDLERMKYQPAKDEEDEDFEEKIDEQLASQSRLSYLLSHLVRQ